MLACDNTPYEKIGNNEPVNIADEVPFKIPDSWEWTRFGQVIVLLSGTDFRPDEYNDKMKGIPYITGASSLSLDGVIVNRWTESPRVIANRGDVLLVCKGSGYGKTVICDIEEAHIARQIMAIKEQSLLDMQYVRLFLQANCDQIKAKGQGVIPGIDRDSVMNLLFPLPPLNEQHKIANRIAEVENLLSSYDLMEHKLSSLQNSFPEQLKKSILQMAVQGKLVPQNPTDEPASMLLERIRAEKHRLIKEGKIKKDKHESVIFRRDNSHYEKLGGIERCIDDEIPFEIPENWVWASVGEICTNIQYGSSQKSSETGDVAVLRMGNIQNGRLIWDKLVYTSDPEEIVKYSLDYNDLLFNRTNSKDLVGKVAIYKGEHPAIYAGYLVRLTPVLLDADYLNYVMQSQYYWIYCQNVRSDAIGQSNINAEKLKQFRVPVPPLSEQQRIVEMVSCLMDQIVHI